MLRMGVHNGSRKLRTIRPERSRAILELQYAKGLVIGLCVPFDVYQYRIRGEKRGISLDHTYGVGEQEQMCQSDFSNFHPYVSLLMRAQPGKRRLQLPSPTETSSRDLAAV